MDRPDLPLAWLPSLPRRYAATAIDALLVLTLFVAPTALWPDDGALARELRVALALAALLIYEPLCTGRFVTLGQRLTGVRVRRFDTGERIGLTRAYARIVFKLVLGLLSFLVLPFVPGRRALHDMMTGTIVIMAGAQVEFARWAATRASEADADTMVRDRV